LIPIWLFTKTQNQGAQTSLHCALCPFKDLENGKYYSDCKVKQEKFPNEQWEQEAKKLWEISEERVSNFVNRK
jgi:hypothetical protein